MHAKFKFSGCPELVVSVSDGHVLFTRGQEEYQPGFEKRVQCGEVYDEHHASPFIQTLSRSEARSLASALMQAAAEV